jgi:Conserved mid region of cactin
VPRKRAADAEEDEWVAGEDRFVLRQAKRRAILRVRGGRAQPVDWLAVVALRAIDGDEDVLLDENEGDGELDVVAPEGVFEGLGRQELEDLAGDIEAYIARETAAANLEFWNVRVSRNSAGRADRDRP